MTEPARHLRVVEAVTTPEGEVLTAEAVGLLQARIDKLEGDRKALEKELRTKRRQISELQRDRVRERLDHPDRAVIERIASYWHRKCRGGDPRVNPMSPARFDAVAALVEMTEIRLDEESGKRQKARRYEPEAFKEAIDGAAFDHYVKPRKNGTLQHFDDLELICRDSKQFEEFRSRAPQRAVPG